MPEGRTRVFPGRSVTLARRPGSAPCAARACGHRAEPECAGSAGGCGRTRELERWPEPGHRGCGGREGLRIPGSQPETTRGALVGCLALDTGNLEKLLLCIEPRVRAGKPCCLERKERPCCFKCCLETLSGVHCRLRCTAEGFWEATCLFVLSLCIGVSVSALRNVNLMTHSPAFFPAHPPYDCSIIYLFLALPCLPDLSCRD